MLLYLLLSLTCSLFVGEAHGRVTWNRTDLTLASQDCPGGYTLVGDKCFMFEMVASVTHDDARNLCHEAKGELVAITTATDFKNLVDYIHANGIFGYTFWVDGRDEETEGVWLTATGEAVPLGTPFWAAFDYHQQPDNALGNEHCLSIPSDWFLYMNDVSCSGTKHFICEAAVQTQREAASAALAPVGPSAVGGRVECLSPFVEVGDLCLLFITWAEETWDVAQQTCAGVSSELLAITDIEVLRTVYLFIQSNGLAGNTFWLGGSDLESEGTWVYTTGEPVPMGTPFWGLTDMSAPSQEPNGGTDENCLAIGNFYNFRDYSCGSKFFPLCLYSG